MFHVERERSGWRFRISRNLTVTHMSLVNAVPRETPIAKNFAMRHAPLTMIAIQAEATSSKAL